MNWPHLAAYFFVGFFLCWRAISWILRWVAQRAGTMRGTDFHHAHATPITRFGGLALAIAFAGVALAIHLWAGLSAPSTRILNIVGASSLAMFALGLWDDIRPLGAKWKLIGQVAIATVVYFCGIRIEVLTNPFTGAELALGAYGFLTTVFWLVALTNLINLIDGLDGLAGGISLMLMCLLLNLGTGVHAEVSMLVSVGVAGALLGFLKFNYPPAKIYMGDGGAYFLGFLIAILSIVNTHKGTVAAGLIAPLFALALPIIDVSLAIFRRGLRGLPLFRPDRKHIHHRLLAFGCSIERAVLILYAFSSFFLLLAFGVFWSQRRLLPIFAGFLFLVLLVAGRSFGFSKGWVSMGAHLVKARALRKETRYVFTLGKWLEMEAERRNSIYGLWQDYQFVVTKMGFSKVSLVLPDGAETWLVKGFDQAKGNFEHTCHKMANGWSIEFTAEKAVLADDLFELLAELAAEAWHKAAVHWRELNQLPVCFSSGSEVIALSSSKNLVRAFSPVETELWRRPTPQGRPKLPNEETEPYELGLFAMPESELEKTDNLRELAR